MVSVDSLPMGGATPDKYDDIGSRLSTNEMTVKLDMIYRLVKPICSCLAEEETVFLM